MQFASPPSVANPWEDRSPSTIAKGAAITPTGSGDAWTYTVPAGRRAYIGWLWCSIYVIASSAGTNRLTATVYVTPDGGSKTPLGAQDILGNSFRAEGQGPAGGGFFLAAGDVLEVEYAETGTGPTYGLRSGAIITEFDA